MAQTPLTTSVEEESTPQPPVRQSPGLRPALIVGAIALGLVLVFGVGSAITDGGAPTPNPCPPHHNECRAQAFRRFRPPAPSSGSLSLANHRPTSSTPSPFPSRPTSSARSTSTKAPRNSIGPSACVSTSQQSVITFYNAEMQRLGWHVTSSGPATGQPGIAILGEKGGDGRMGMEMATVVAPTTFSGAHESTAFTVELYQLEDQATGPVWTGQSWSTAKVARAQEALLEIKAAAPRSGRHSPSSFAPTGRQTGPAPCRRGGRGSSPRRERSRSPPRCSRLP